MGRREVNEWINGQFRQTEYPDHCQPEGHWHTSPRERTMEDVWRFFGTKEHI